MDDTVANGITGKLGCEGWEAQIPLPHFIQFFFFKKNYLFV